MLHIVGVNFDKAQTAIELLKLCMDYLNAQHF